MSQPVICPQCKNANAPGTVRCLRCYKLLLTQCTGSCSKCKEKNKCGG